ncbi:MAG: hypothetical protein ACP5P4_09795 [Steroidobacteraceae bacterium]
MTIDSDEPDSSGVAPLETRIVKIGKFSFAVGTLWLSWATPEATATGTRAWLANQKDVLPSFEALFIVPGAENRVDIGLSSMYQPRLRALAQVVAAHPETFATALPSEAFRWGVIAETAEGVYLCAASRDGLPLLDTLADPENVDAARARIDSKFADIHWAGSLPLNEFAQKVLSHASNEPVALRRSSKVKMRLVLAAIAVFAVSGVVLFIGHYRAERARMAQLAALAAVKPPKPVPSGFQSRNALRACLSAFQHTQGSAPGWTLVEASCDVREATFVWRRDRRGLATNAPPGTVVMAGLRTAMMRVPLRIRRCELGPKDRYAATEAQISDWAIRTRERWRAAGGINPTVSVEGIIPSWEMPIQVCARTISVRWIHTGLWRLSIAG